RPDRLDQQQGVVVRTERHEHVASLLDVVETLHAEVAGGELIRIAGVGLVTTRGLARTLLLQDRLDVARVEGASRRFRTTSGGQHEAQESSPSLHDWILS